jgi:hypothetical protein
MPPNRRPRPLRCRLWRPGRLDWRAGEWSGGAVRRSGGIWSWPSLRRRSGGGDSATLHRLERLRLDARAQQSPALIKGARGRRQTACFHGLRYDAPAAADRVTGTAFEYRAMTRCALLCADLLDRPLWQFLPQRELREHSQQQEPSNPAYHHRIAPSVAQCCYRTSTFAHHRICTTFVYHATSNQRKMAQ